MKIKLKLDYHGNPLLELTSENKSLEDEALKLFIREAKLKGIEITSDSDYDDDKSANIEIKYKTKKS
jgi:hypothetical protein